MGFTDIFDPLFVQHLALNLPYLSEGEIGLKSENISTRPFILASPQTEKTHLKGGTLQDNTHNSSYTCTYRKESGKPLSPFSVAKIIIPQTG
jgi:hypothetical protein